MKPPVKWCAPAGNTSTSQTATARMPSRCGRYVLVEVAVAAEDADATEVSAEAIRDDAAVRVGRSREEPGAVRHDHHAAAHGEATAEVAARGRDQRRCDHTPDPC